MIEKQRDKRVEMAIGVLIHALQADTVVMDDDDLPVEDQGEYKRELLRDLFDLVGREL